MNVHYIHDADYDHRLSWRVHGSYGESNVLVLLYSVPGYRVILIPSFWPTGCWVLEISMPLTTRIIWPRSIACWFWASIYLSSFGPWRTWFLFFPFTILNNCIFFLLFFFFESENWFFFFFFVLALAGCFDSFAYSFFFFFMNGPSPLSTHLDLLFSFSFLYCAYVFVCIFYHSFLLFCCSSVIVGWMIWIWNEKPAFSFNCFLFAFLIAWDIFVINCIMDVVTYSVICNPLNFLWVRRSWRAR